LVKGSRVCDLLSWQILRLSYPCSDDSEKFHRVSMHRFNLCIGERYRLHPSLPIEGVGYFMKKISEKESIV
jgi:hypothetical protein